ncbi:MAG: C1 family peptidase [Candidatus Wallbacteria bacterium]|nr:C1 family peptidase [Candidatus Wallbacteria bacterium]
MKFLCAFFSLAFLATTCFAATENPLREVEDFQFAGRALQEDGGSYTISFDAAPKGIPLEALCGTIVPESAAVYEHMQRVPLDESRDLPAKLDWREQTVLPAIRNQGSCGSCWAFSAVGILESAIAIKTGNVLNLSEQDLLNCNTYGYGCDGGWMDILGHFKTYGSPLESAEPYVGKENSCKSGLDRSYKIISWGTASSATSSIKQAIATYGPVSSVVAADSSFQYYSGGVFNHDSSVSVNHAIILVGWDDSLGNGCWILRNSWGTGWGNSGYMYIEYGKCKVGSYNYVVTY